MAAIFQTIDIAVAGLDRALRNLPLLLVIICLPGVLAAGALVALEVVVQDQLHWGWAPQWSRNAVWAPFQGAAYLMLLRWVLGKRRPMALLQPSDGGLILLSAIVFLAWISIADAIDELPLAAVLWFAPIHPDQFRWEDFAGGYYALRVLVGLVHAAFAVVFFGLLVVIATDERIDVRELWRLLRLQPLQLYGASLLADIATTGADYVLGSALASWGLNAAALAPQGMVPWRANIHWAFLGELADLPYVFLSFAIQGCILAEAYRRLLLIEGPEHARTTGNESGRT